MERNKKLTLFTIAKLYRVSRITLVRRRKEIRPRIETITNSRNLDPFEEQVIIRRVLDLSRQGFSLVLSIVEDIAKSLSPTSFSLSTLYFLTIFRPENGRGGFRGTRLVLFDLEKVIL